MALEIDLKGIQRTRTNVWIGELNGAGFVTPVRPFRIILELVVRRLIVHRTGPPFRMLYQHSVASNMVVYQHFVS